MEENPYKPPTTPALKRNMENSRGSAFAVSIISMVVGLIFGWQTLVAYAFSTMVDPKLVGRERARMIADNFLFGDGPLQIVAICIFVLLTTTGLTSSVVFLVSAITNHPTLRNSTIISCGAGIFVTLSMVIWLLSL